MSKPNVTLQPSKAVVAEIAARIYAAYISTGSVKKESADKWMKRAIRESITIVRAIDAAVQSDDELPAGQPVVFEPQSEQAPSAGGSDVERVLEEVLLDEQADKSNGRSANDSKSKRKPSRKKNVERPEDVEDAADAAKKRLQQSR